jgi:hypothetical protein
MNAPAPLHTHQGSRSLRDEVDELLPGWQSWYPSLFDAAQDLGILRARVCDLSSLVLSNRHASIYNEAVQAFRNQWSVEEPEAQDAQPQSHPQRKRRELPDDLSSDNVFPDDIL